ncbi:MAG TPA: sigma-70 family RNA polymerase sigma factor [Gemmatimonadaceae bacterium]|nr:sigma-70 family RNA polymerase sigma factor [Gemmatimonadaceae bacterium]
MPVEMLEPTASTIGAPAVSRTPTEDTAQWFERSILGVLPDLVGAARRLTKHATDAEDLVADAISKAWFAVDTLKDRERFRGWIFRILTNAFLAQRRARTSQPVEEPLPDEQAGFSLFEQLHQPFLLWWSTPEKEFLDKLLREDLIRAIESLPESFRVVVILADVQGLTYQEIADALDAPIGTVRSRLARGRSLLQKALWEHARDAGVRTQRKNPDVT